MEEENQSIAKMISDSWFVRGSAPVGLVLVLAALMQNWTVVAICAGLLCAMTVVGGLSVRYRVRKNKVK